MLLRPGLRCAWVPLAIFAASGQLEAQPNAERLFTRESLQRRAERTRRAWTLPDFEHTPAAIRRAARNALLEADRRLARIATQQLKRATLESTYGALDHALADLETVANRLRVLREASPDPALRDAAASACLEIQARLSSVPGPEITRLLVAVNASHPPAPETEEAALVASFLELVPGRSPAGSAVHQDQIIRLRQELAELCAAFRRNASAAAAVVQLNRSALAGVPEALFPRLTPGSAPDSFEVHAEVAWQLGTVLDQARLESTRLALAAARDRLAADTNLPVLRDILARRLELARLLGSPDWAEHRVQSGMAGSAAAVRRFLLQASEALNPAFQAELASLQDRKRRVTGADAEIREWDWRYYLGRGSTESASLVPPPAPEFELPAVLEAMWRTCEQAFGIRCGILNTEGAWTEDLQVCPVLDATSGAPLGAAYLDLFAREGKAERCAHLNLLPGRLLPGGMRQCSVVAILASFSPPTDTAPARVSLQEVQSLFHEFGHALQSILATNRRARLGGSSVPGDFVEVPAQLLERWAGTDAVLDLCARGGPEPAGTGQGLRRPWRQSLDGAAAIRTRRQIAFALLDLELHGPQAADPGWNPVAVANAQLEKHYLAPPSGTAPAAALVHLANGYDAAYYGYLWADAIAADLARRLRGGPDGLPDPAAGRRFREEVLAPGAGREPALSLKRLLGTAWAPDPQSLIPERASE